MLGAGVELVARRQLLRRLAAVPGQSLAEPYETGSTGKQLRAAEALTAAGLAGAVLGGVLSGGAARGRRGRAVSALSGAALVAASAMTRWGIFQAGMASARDPKYTIVPQRARKGGNGIARRGVPGLQLLPVSLAVAGEWPF
jgi:hypothetical protein